ncbi:MAG TPA: FtsX-like permease family protein, partial [Anaerolineaceae bacterium]|nr:FtsX-like permease family protein [Anaerolineaceae bacterium]
MIPRTLWNVGWRYLLRHGWQTALMVLGIVLGVAVVVAVDIANASAAQAFELSAAAISGKATHQISGGPQGLDQSLYLDLRKAHLAQAATPLVTQVVSSPQLGGQPLQLLGIDPFADVPFRSYLGRSDQVSTDDLAAFFTRPGTVLLSSTLAEQYGLALGDKFSLDVGGNLQMVSLVGVIEPADVLSRRALESLVLVDIATAQELSGKIGRLDRIDLILPAGDSAALTRLQDWLPSGVQLSTSQAGANALDEMTAAFRLNLTALSLLALMVGLFLIYNTMTFSVVQRRPLFGTLRCLGVTRGEVFRMVTSEAALVGMIGSVLGIGLGVLVGRSMVGMVTQTVNDLYFATTVQGVDLPLESLIKGGVMGVIATIATAFLPAWEAARVPPRAVLLRSGLEARSRSNLPWLALGGVGMLLLGALIFAIPQAGLYVGFGGIFVVVIGFAMLSAVGMVLMMRGLGPLLGRIFGLVGKMAPRGLVNSLSRTAVAVAALMVAVAVAVGMTLMIDSFRYTVTIWLGQTLQGDIYIHVPSFTATQPMEPIDSLVLPQLESWPGVMRVNVLRSTMMEVGGAPAIISATSNPQIGRERLYKVLEGTPEQVWVDMQGGAVLVSEPLANRMGLQVGDMLSLPTLQGAKDFPVRGIFFDYAASQGSLLIARDVYIREWQDEAVTAIDLRVAGDVSVDQVTEDLRAGLASAQTLLIRPNQALRDDVMEVFDRTFAITLAMRLFATVVAFIGVLSATLLLQLEKKNEVGVLRALGLT